MRGARKGCRFAMLAVLFLWTAGTAARGEQEYLLGNEDVILVTVWEHPDLSHTATVRADGTVTLPPLGDVPAAGKSTSELARDLENRIYSVLRLTTQVTVSVVSFNSRTVYLGGQVTTPGKYSFESIPGLVDLLGMTGGLGPAADLSRVRILRRSSSGNQTLTVDLSRAMQTGDLSGVPALEPGDMIFVPSSAASGEAVTGGGAVYIMGEVAKPGPYAAAPGLTLLQLLSVAGGYTPRANLSSVSVLAQDEANGAYRMQVDLTREMREGRSGPEVRSGDTVVIPPGRGGWAPASWNALLQGLGAARDVFLIRQSTKR